MTLQNALGGLALDTSVQDVVDALGGQQVTLGQLLAALQGTVTVHVDNQPSGTATEATLASLRDDVANGIPVTVSNPTANPETGLAKDATLTSTIASLRAAVEGFGAFVQQQQREVMNLRRQPQYARDSNDQMRVAASGTVGISQINWAANNAFTSWYGGGAPMTMDAREQMKEASRQSIQMARANRWKIT